MLYKIANEALHVTVNSYGAELWSIRSSDGTEYLWQGDPAYWSGRAPTLFPFVGHLCNSMYRMDDMNHELPTHGFASSCEFQMREYSAQRVTLELHDTPRTYEQYPRRFLFRVSYMLCENQLSVAYEVENLDDNAMYFGVGGHPGINVPLEPHLRFEDYRLRFSTQCVPVQLCVGDDRLLTRQKREVILAEHQELPLAHALFDQHAVILENTPGEVMLYSPLGKRSVVMTYDDMPYLGLWQWPHKEAPYLCLEPWKSLPASHDEIPIFEEKKDLIKLKPTEHYHASWSLRIN